MKNKICVYTCITGDYDNLLELKNPEKELDYYCFTNNKNLKSKTWKMIYISDDSLDNSRLSRKIKILGHDIVNKYDIAVWTDADVVWERPITEFVSTFFQKTHFAAFRHHARKTIQEEAVACLRLRKDSKEKILETLEIYKKEAFPDSGGLCEFTVFIKDPKDATVKATMDMWYKMVKNHSRRDQLSFGYAAWKTNLKFTYIEQNVWDNEWFSTVKHNHKTDITECHVYYGNPDENFDFEKYFVYKYTRKGINFSFNTVVPVDTDAIEFNPSNVIGTKYNNLTIKPSPKSIKTHGIEFDAACNEHGVFRAFGDFKKGDKLIFSVDMSIITEPNDYIKLIEQEWIRIDQLSYNLAKTKDENTILRSKVARIENNKIYKLLKKAKKIIHPTRSTIF